MAKENYICPRCNSRMYWTGEISQDSSEKRWLKILYLYKCDNPRCRYESKYDELDPSGERIVWMHKMELMED